MVGGIWLNTLLAKLVDAASGPAPSAEWDTTHNQIQLYSQVLCFAPKCFVWFVVTLILWENEFVCRLEHHYTMVFPYAAECGSHSERG